MEGNKRMARSEVRGADAMLQLAEFLTVVEEHCLLDAIPLQSYKASDL